MLVLEATPEALDEFRVGQSLETAEAGTPIADAVGDGVSFIEMVVPDGARIVGKTSESLGLAWRHRTTLMGIARKGTRITRAIRHPQLTAVVVWTLAHLLVNGDTPSFILFGGLGLWAVGEMIVINRASGPRGAYHAPAIKSEIIAVVATVVVFSITAAIHIWLGYNPFG